MVVRLVMASVSLAWQLTEILSVMENLHPLHQVPVMPDQTICLAAKCAAPNFGIPLLAE
ncbi:hypothetical protein D3C71_2197840 [compost metagenome]